MKKLIALLLIISGAAYAADPAVAIDNASNVYVDGTNVGQPADAIANNPALAPDIQRALVAFVTTTKANADSAIATKETEKQTAITAAQQASASSIAANAQQLADAQAALATAQQQLADANARLDAAAAQITSLQQQVRDLQAAAQQQQGGS